MEFYAVYPERGRNTPIYQAPAGYRCHLPLPSCPNGPSSSNAEVSVVPKWHDDITNIIKKSMRANS
ncbi:predicted protein [Botrytis cinerea T4]|uniref:Uncharacterized protein n=1 Tax=Botryotinia fuckeliana (strain T4) TaxID=999810 RepID=G2XQP8_BOTF4|nr:predicted protein [Botrytis cinerea T4]